MNSSAIEKKSYVLLLITKFIQVTPFLNLYIAKHQTLDLALIA